MTGTLRDEPFRCLLSLLRSTEMNVTNGKGTAKDCGLTIQSKSNIAILSVMFQYPFPVPGLQPVPKGLRQSQSVTIEAALGQIVYIEDALSRHSSCFERGLADIWPSSGSDQIQLWHRFMRSVFSQLLSLDRPHALPIATLLPNTNLSKSLRETEEL